MHKLLGFLTKLFSLDRHIWKDENPHAVGESPKNYHCNQCGTRIAISHWDTTNDLEEKYNSTWVICRKDHNLSIIGKSQSFKKALEYVGVSKSCKLQVVTNINQA
jgi:hypothetical protein